MANLKKIHQQVLPLSVKFGGQIVNFKYKIGAIDSEWEERMREAQTSGDFSKVIDCLFEIVTDWNLETEYVRDESDGEMRPARDGEEGELRKIPLEAQAVIDAEMPTHLIGMILSKFQEDASQGGSQARKK